MVGNIKYIYNGMSYKELKNNIRESRRVRAFPLVDNPSMLYTCFRISAAIMRILIFFYVLLANMILLGSIQRTELIGLIERHIGRDRRLQVAAKRQKEARVRYSRLLCFVSWNVCSFSINNQNVRGSHDLVAT